jgi:hypothetical protein
MSRILVAAASLALLLVAAAPRAAQACSCAPVQPADAVAAAELIFTGTALSGETRRYETTGEDFGGSRDRLVTRFDVHRLWKGTTADPVEIVTELNSAACGHEFEVGKTYTVFAMSQEGTYSTNLCLMLPALGDAGARSVDVLLKRQFPNAPKL